MVYYFTSLCCSDVIVYMGKNKFENEDLIRWGHPEDVWFHVEHLSSAHVYVRLPFTGYSWDALPDSLLTEVAQLVKHNSLEGCKRDTVDIVYTPWSNLKKTSDMNVGQVGFQDPRAVKYIRSVAKAKETIKRLEKTRTESFPHLEKEREERDAKVRSRLKKEAQEKKRQLREEEKRKAEEKSLKSYASLHATKNYTESNEIKGDGTIESCREMEDDFM